MSNSSDNYRSGRRVTLPPIRDLFRDEFTRSRPPTQESPSTTLARLRMNDDERVSPTTRPLSPRPNPPPRMYRSTSEQHLWPRVQSTFSQEHPAPSAPIYQDPYQFTEAQLISNLPSHTPIPQQHDPLPNHQPSDYSTPHPQPHISQSPNRRQNRPLNPSNQAPYPNYTPEFSIESRAREAVVQMPRLSALPNPAGTAQVDDLDSPPALVQAVAPWVITTNLDVGQFHGDDERTPIARPFDAGPIEQSSRIARLLDEGLHPPLGKYDCKFCGKLFNRPSSLRIHLNSHTGEKPFVCPHPDCGRSFSVLSNMRRHTRVHTNNPKEQEPEESNDETSTQPSPTTPSTPRLSTPVQEAAPMQIPPPSQTHCRQDSNASASSSSSKRSRGTSSEGELMGSVDRSEQRSRHRPT